MYGTSMRFYCNGRKYNVHALYIYDRNAGPATAVAYFNKLVFNQNITRITVARSRLHKQNY